jgi:hypothetical protein
VPGSTVDGVTIEQPHPNGAGKKDPHAHARMMRNRIILIAFGLIAVAWIFALIWSVTVATHSPERLDRTAVQQASAVCNGAQSRLKTLPNNFPRAGADRVARIRSENAILTDMATRFGSIRPTHSAPTNALRAWSKDWSRVIAARGQYASNLEQRGQARLVLPATSSGGLKPVTDKMDDFVRENHPDLDACFTQALALDTVEGPRVYKAVTS